MSRRAGLSIPLFSIRTPGGWGLGEIPDLVPMARWAERAGFRVLQLLPVCEAAHGQSSPYFARTAFALDPAYLRLDDVEDFQVAGGVAGLPPDLRRGLDLARAAPRVAWGAVREAKRLALRLAFASFVEREWSRGSERSRAMARWCDEQAHWLDDYALFSALGEAFVEGGGAGGWEAWPAPLADRHPAALEAARGLHAARILQHRYVQWLLGAQWTAARRDVAAEGVTLMGDLPFMVAGDSADVWQREDEFRHDATIGVPPDAFSAEGQDWGLPVFRWDVMKREDYAWMRARARRAAEMFGLYRIDHVVGLFRTWYILGDKVTKGFIPDDEPSQIAQGERLLEILKAATPGEDGESPVIAEDLGVVPDFVRASLTRLGVPGYRVLRWENDAGVYRDPARYPRLSVATTGTHDTESLADWYDALGADGRRALVRIPALAALSAGAPAAYDERVRDAILACVYASGSDLVLLPLADCLGERQRINVPGTVSQDNWSCRMEQTVDELSHDGAVTARLAALARLR